ERGWRWARRNPLGAALAALLAASAVGSALAAFLIAGARAQAERALGAEEEARRRAEASEQEARRRLARLAATAGLRAAADGELGAALAWLVEALRLDAGDPDRERPHRLGIGAALALHPKLTRVAFHERPVGFAAFSPDGRLLVTATRHPWSNPEVCEA